MKIVGVESKVFPAIKESLAKGSLQNIKSGYTIADGISVKSPGKLTYGIARKYIDDVMVVDDSSIVKTMFLLMERLKLVIKPAGTASLAYLLSNVRLKTNENVVSLLSGGNVDIYIAWTGGGQRSYADG